MSLTAGHVFIYQCLWVRPPHPKIALCFCSERRWVFFFNSNPCFHGIAQLEVEPGEHNTALTKPCFLNLSETLCLSLDEVKNARDTGIISAASRDRVVAVLANPIKTLPGAQRALALEKLQGLVLS